MTSWSDKPWLMQPVFSEHRDGRKIEAPIVMYEMVTNRATEALPAVKRHIPRPVSNYDIHRLDMSATKPFFRRY